MAKKQELQAAEQEQLPAESSDLLMEDAGSGSEDISTDDMMIPRINVLQALSPQVKKKDPEYVEGAEEGMFYNTATGTLYNGDEGILVVPVMYQRRHTEWIPRNKGGGLVQDYGTDDSILERCKMEEGRYVTSDGNEVVVSATYIIFIVDKETGEYEQAVFSLAGTQMKKARRWNTMIKTLQMKSPQGKVFNPPSFAKTYRITTVPESNDKGQWMGVSIKPEEGVLELSGGQDIYLAARDLRNSLKAGEVKIAPEQPPAEPEEGDEPF